MGSAQVVEAYAWISLSAATGNAIAISHRAALELQLTAQQIVAGKARATELQTGIAGGK
jgi:hypothetical protein